MNRKKKSGNQINICSLYNIYMYFKSSLEGTVVSLIIIWWFDFTKPEHPSAPSATLGFLDLKFAAFNSYDLSFQSTCCDTMSFFQRIARTRCHSEESPRVVGVHLNRDRRAEEGVNLPIKPIHFSNWAIKFSRAHRQY